MRTQIRMDIILIYLVSGNFVKMYMKLAGEEENWSDKVLWSNLYKVAPYNGGNRVIS